MRQRRRFRTIDHVLAAAPPASNEENESIMPDETFPNPEPSEGPGVPTDAAVVAGRSR